jgi:archaellum component FlaF (FlaF/FlaG flagellin family)
VVGISDAATDLFQGVKGTTDDIASFGGITSSSSSTTDSSNTNNGSTVVDKLQALVLGVGSSSSGQVRPRRALYGPQKARVLRPYVLADAQAAALLIEKGTYSDD